MPLSKRGWSEEGSVNALRWIGYTMMMVVFRGRLAQAVRIDLPPQSDARNAGEKAR
jgi:hypothetical protein